MTTKKDDQEQLVAATGLPKAGSVAIKNPHFPQGYEFSLPGLGLVHNYAAPKNVDVVQVQLFQQALPHVEWPEDGNYVLTYEEGEK